MNNAHKWHIWRGNHDTLMIRDDNGFVVADVPLIANSRAEYLNQQREERAALVAAAPELLHALETVYANAADHPEKIRAIIDEALEKVHAWPRATSP